jgi:hypothetical protein
MATFSVVTDVHVREQLWVNLDQVQSISRDNGANVTVIIFAYDVERLTVRETPEQIVGSVSRVR